MSVVHQVAVNGPVDREPLLRRTRAFCARDGARCDRDVLLIAGWAGFDLLRNSGGVPGQFQLELLLTATIVRGRGLPDDRWRCRRQEC